MQRDPFAKKVVPDQPANFFLDVTFSATQRPSTTQSDDEETVEPANQSGSTIKIIMPINFLVQTANTGRLHPFFIQIRITGRLHPFFI